MMSKKKKPKILIVDASVLRAAGETNHPVSAACRESLKGILEICHKVAVSSELYEEWKKHESKWSKIWYGSMARKGKKAVLIETDSQVRIHDHNLNDREKAALQKDLCIILPSLSGKTDGIVISLDDQIQKIFQKSNPGLAKNIKWHNPVKTASPKDYLRSL